MQSETFKLRAAASQESMNDAMRVLQGAAGVSKVTPSLLRNELSVEFQPGVASRQSLQAALAGAGHAVETANQTGGCGGGGGGCSCS